MSADVNVSGGPVEDSEARLDALATSSLVVWDPHIHQPEQDPRWERFERGECPARSQAR